ncbi:MAG: hypothetical protein VYA34_09465 [Myxococcota bacterium]|nr:hypothetical protein [Myxococcota bacterium]
MIRESGMATGNGKRRAGHIVRSLQQVQIALEGWRISLSSKSSQQAVVCLQGFEKGTVVWAPWATVLLDPHGASGGEHCRRCD